MRTLFLLPLLESFTLPTNLRECSALALLGKSHNCSYGIVFTFSSTTALVKSQLCCFNRFLNFQLSRWQSSHVPKARPRSSTSSFSRAQLAADLLFWIHQTTNLDKFNVVPAKITSASTAAVNRIF